MPKKEFFKDSYPLPRDVAGRTLIRIGKKTIPEVLTKLKIEDKSILSELIDTIGHINFNTKIANIYEPLKTCYIQNNKEYLIIWKIIRVFSGINESEEFLRQIQTKTKEDRLKKKVERSLRLINSRKPSGNNR